MTSFLDLRRGHDFEVRNQVGTIVLVHIKQADGSWKSDEDYDAVYGEEHHFMVDFCNEDGETLDMPVLAGTQLEKALDKSG